MVAAQEEVEDLLDSKPCSCRGDNSNCYKCFGTGMVAPKSGTGKQVIPAFGAPLTYPPHALKEMSAFQAPAAKSRSAKAKRHRLSAPNAVTKPSSALLCSMCRVVAPTQLVLDIHKQRVHGINDGKLSSRSKPLAVVSTDLPLVEHSPTLVKDGAEGWNGSFRDHGQFGSYPSFDPSDDESDS